MSAPLFDPAEHEELTATPWDAGRAADAIEEIVRAAERERADDLFWPLHPRDDYGFATRSCKTLWLGAAGVLWALDFLARTRELERRDDYGAAAQRLLPAYLDHPEWPVVVPGLLLGEVGVLFAASRFDRTSQVLDRLEALIVENVANPEHELFNGAPGTMLVALHLFEESGDLRWREAWLRSFEYMWSQWRVDPELGIDLWIQYRNGRLIRSVGAGHGFASNVRSLARGEQLLDVEMRSALHSRASATAVALAVEHDELANWPTAADSFWASEFPIRVQWCHGAPGMITSLAGIAGDRRFEEVLSRGGELTWRAGPLRKGPSLCHGTAGNGCAFLALHDRTGETSWLERARLFAMHAIEQVDRARSEYGQGRHSLWTGDLGVAVYLHQCLEGRWLGMPIIDLA